MALQRLPDAFVTTRDALHQLAFFAVAPTRYEATGRMGMRATNGGFGTPEFNGRIARVEGTSLVHEQDGQVATQTITTVREAARFFGIEYRPDWFTTFRDPLRPMDPDTHLQLDDESVQVLGHWFRFGTDVLDELSTHGTGDDDVSEVQLWPEHFDPAMEMGSEEKGVRAAYGASPGDEEHDEPYFYVAAWGEIDRANPYWNDETFNGSSLGYAELLETAEPSRIALDFLLEGHRILHAS